MERALIEMGLFFAPVRKTITEKNVSISITAFRFLAPMEEYVEMTIEVVTFPATV
jgi:hypothetical protein